MPSSDCMAASRRTGQIGKPGPGATEGRETVADLRLLYSASIASFQNVFPLHAENALFASLLAETLARVQIC